MCVLCKTDKSANSCAKSFEIYHFLLILYHFFIDFVIILQRSFLQRILHRKGFLLFLIHILASQQGQITIRGQSLMASDCLWHADH